jgi:hypothetical protein
MEQYVIPNSTTRRSITSLNVCTGPLGVRAPRDRAVVAPVPSPRRGFRLLVPVIVRGRDYFGGIGRDVIPHALREIRVLLGEVVEGVAPDQRAG